MEDLFESDESLASPMILIVEDHPLVAKFYQMALERAGGFTCLVTEDVDEILAAVEAGRVSLALLDVSLCSTQFEGRPIDGVELARLVKVHAPGRLPIILATAQSITGDREHLLSASGADFYLQKPVYDARELVDTIRKLLVKR
jgi:CheY-like chemotaxis protein